MTSSVHHLPMYFYCNFSTLSFTTDCTNKRCNKSSVFSFIVQIEGSMWSSNLRIQLISIPIETYNQRLKTTQLFTLQVPKRCTAFNVDFIHLKIGFSSICNAFQVSAFAGYSRNNNFQYQHYRSFSFRSQQMTHELLEYDACIN